MEDGDPGERRTLVAVPTLFASPEDARQQVERLEVHFIANAEGDVYYALVSDFHDAASEQMPGDDAILAAAREGIARLNARHGPAPGGGARFLLAHRRRMKNESEGAWIGWERKRGKLHELNRLLRGATDTTFLPIEGGAPQGVRCVVTLDADTRIPIGAVGRLVGTIMHPLNRPRIDPASRRVVEGYAVLQPRVTAPLPGRGGSHFQRMISGPTGVDPYAGAVSDVYQDLFAEGSYTGKGIYDVDAFEAALEGRVPENTLLSHDLFEGLFARSGLVTDVELFESAPANYLSAAGRQYRWARGDWQLLPWILGERFPLIHRWKMLDNLRRTLSSPSAFGLLLACWLWPDAMPALWTAFILTVLAVPPLIPAIAGIWPRMSGISKRSHVRAVLRDFAAATDQIGLQVVTVANGAWLMMHAIVRTLWRLGVSHRHLLEWRASGIAAARAPRAIPGFYRRMAGSVAITVAAAIAVLLVQPASAPLAAPFLLLWLFAPGVAWWLSRPLPAVAAGDIDEEDARALRLIARRTWNYFATFVTPGNHSLPPDNFQETPRPVVTTRTSPTNIGLYLLSIFSAHDFGWVGTLDAMDRLEATLAATKSLETYRGHLFNWYDTITGQALEPRYVSSVDSGNLAGSLIAVANGCDALLRDGARGVARLSGITDAVLLLREAVEQARHGGDGNERAIERLDAALGVFSTLLTDAPSGTIAYATRIAELEAAARTVSDRARDAAGAQPDESPRSITSCAAALRDAVATHDRDLDTLLPWCRLRVDDAAVPALARFTPDLPLADVPAMCAAALSDVATVRAELVADGEANAGRLRASTRSPPPWNAARPRSTHCARDWKRRLRRRAPLVAAMDFRFLFDPSRMLFAIGYRMTDRALDDSRYDLLASEARLLSFIAIAKGDVPARHWFRLGRLLTPVRRDSVLMSWAGSMFEYLMPALVMRTPPGSLLEQTSRLVVQRQMDYGEERGTPWGVSESGYFARDLGMTFQYASFGVPVLVFVAAWETTS